MSPIYWSLPSEQRPPVSSPGRGSFLQGGSADVQLEDGVKSPDFSHYDQAGTDSDKVFPTVVWEVAYSETERKLARDCARFVACSRGRILLAIAINIACQKSPDHNSWDLESVTCSFWEVEDIEVSSELDGNKLGFLIRADGEEDEGDHIPPPAKKYTCTSQIAEKYVTFNVHESRRYQIYPPTADNPIGQIEILQKHIYRTPTVDKKEDVVLAIPFSLIREVIVVHQNQQGRIDSEHKRRRDQDAEDTLLEATLLRFKKARP